MTTLTDTQVITASGGLVELGYKATISGSHSITQTGASRYSLMSSPLSVVCDGSPVLVEVFLAGARPDLGAGNRQLYVGLYIDGVEVFTQFGLFITPAAGDVYRPSPISYRYTPTAGAHTFEIKASVDAGGGYIEGGSATRPPSYIRVSKIVQATQWPAVTTGTIICTSSTRPASPFVGQSIYETDTSLAYTYNGSAWVQTGDSTGAWTAFTPTISQSSTVTYSGPMRYTRIGRTIHANCALYITGSGSAGTGVTVSLPVAAQASLPVIGSAWIYDASSGVRYVCAVDLASTTTVGFLHDTSGAASWGQNPSIGLANADQIRFGITYEAAS